MTTTSGRHSSTVSIQRRTLPGSSRVAADIVCLTVAQRRISPWSIAKDGPNTSFTWPSLHLEKVEGRARRHHAHVVLAEQRADHDLRPSGVAEALPVDPVEDPHKRENLGRSKYGVDDRREWPR